MSEKKTTSVTIRVSPETKKALEKVAETKNTGVGAIVRDALHSVTSSNP